MIKLIKRHENFVTRLAPNFLNEWSDEDCKIVKNKVIRFFANYDVYNPYEFFGLPYTSSSSFAMESNTNSLFNIEVSGKVYNFEYVALSETKDVYFAFWDSEENEIFIRG